jgi:iron-sulfur cluster assembly protein
MARFSSSTPGTRTFAAPDPAQNSPRQETKSQAGKAVLSHHEKTHLNNAPSPLLGQENHTQDEKACQEDTASDNLDKKNARSADTAAPLNDAVPAARLSDRSSDISPDQPPARTSDQSLDRSSDQPAARPSGQPLLSLTALAKVKVAEILRQQGASTLRIKLRARGCSGLSYVMECINSPTDQDEIIPLEDLPEGQLCVHRQALLFLVGTQMDYQDQQTRSGFVFRNPNEKGQCGCGTSFHV